MDRIKGHLFTEYLLPLSKTSLLIRAIVQHRTILSLSISIILISSIIGLVIIRKHAILQLKEEKERLKKQSYIPFEREDRYPSKHSEIKFIQNLKNFRAIALYQNSYFAATDAGLIQLSTDGKFIRHMTTLDGLPENDLLSLCSYNSKLYIGTRSQGLALYNGENFECYRWTDRKAESITSFLSDTNRLLIGTFSGGLIEFDGHRFKELTVGTERTRIVGINYLSKDGTRLYVGTFDNGLWVEDAGRWLHFTTDNGLLSNRIVGVSERSDALLVATDLGISSAPVDRLTNNDGHFKLFQPLVAIPTLSSLVKIGDDLLFCKDNGEMNLNSNRSTKSINWSRPNNLSGCRLSIIGQDLWIMTSNGIWRNSKNLDIPSNLIFTPINLLSGSKLSSNIISALSFDYEKRLWVGNFREGIDILSSDGSVIHKRSELAREINSIVSNRSNKSVYVTSSKGVVRFDQSLKEQYVTKSDGLLSSSVLHLIPSLNSSNSPQPNNLILATSKGLSLGQPGKFRSLTTVQGLPSNSVYTVYQHGRYIYAGTLSGLAEIEAGRVIRTFKDSNSKLTHNWITAICNARERLFVGTYGGGIYELTKAGELTNISSELGRFSVNPNAIFTDEERLYAGTLEGIAVLDLQSQKWHRLKTELPSQTVLSISGNEKYIYFGTTNGIAQIDKVYFYQQLKDRSL
jgi:ligand-binding sensor domain-containing protein